MSNLHYYKDNILNKIQENKDLEKMERWIKYDCLEGGQNVKLSFGPFSPKLKISKYTILDLIKKQKEYNETMIEKYLKLSFKGEEEVFNDSIENTEPTS